MKRFLLAIMLIGISVFALAQENKNGDIQIGVFGGVSVPVGEYKTVPNTKTGFFTGLFVDKYFKGNKFGLGIDARYIFNSVNRQDSFHFSNGFIETTYKGKTRFQDYLITIGPSYKFSKDRFHLEAYLRGGVIFQEFPEYRSSINFETFDVNNNSIVTSHQILSTKNELSNKANSWVGLGGVRFNYSINRNFVVFAHVDYVQSFGDTFGSKSSMFITESLVDQESNSIVTSSDVKNVFDHYKVDTLMRKSTHHQTINAGLGIKYIFGSSAMKKKDVDAIESKSVINYDNIPKSIAKQKDLQIVVKDKQTNLSLSGVTVSLEGNGLNEKSITDANGQALKVLSVEPNNYIVYGEKNGIKTPVLTLSESDFKSNSQLIFKEIYHDDPRFTLVGETFDCELSSNLSNINTVLTNSVNRSTSSQISDVTGKFIYQLNPESDYTVMANQQGRYSQTELVSTKGLNRSQTLYVTLKLGVCDLEKNDVWVLKNILYDFDKSEIRDDAAIILDNVVSVMLSNPSLRIELSSHTDSRGNDNYNLMLSQRRADAAVNYLVSKGINKSRLVSKGYGETRLLNDCRNGEICTEEQHQVNRRTEVKILDYSN